MPPSRNPSGRPEKWEDKYRGTLRVHFNELGLRMNQSEGVPTSELAKSFMDAMRDQVCSPSQDGTPSPVAAVIDSLEGSDLHDGLR